MKNFALSILCLCLLASCRMDDLEQSASIYGGADVSYPVTVEVDCPTVTGNMKSTFLEDDIDRLTDLNVFVYHSGRLMADYCFYTDDLSSIMLTLPFDKDDYNIYMVGNVGRLQPPADESGIPQVRYVVDSYDGFRVRGVPVAEVFRNYMKGTLAHFKLKRLVGQYNVRMKTSASDAEYHVKDVRLLNCALDMYPFGLDAKASSFTGRNHGDMLTEEDISRLNEGQPVSLYLVENLQGELLPGNTDRRKKIPSRLEGLRPGLSDCCTYIEITADIITPSATYKDGKYRFYLGQNETTDFSVVRNTLYDVTLDFTQNMVNEEEWRIEVEEPELNVSVNISKDVAQVVMGAEDMVYVQVYDRDGRQLDFDVVNPGADSRTFAVERSDATYNGRPAVALRITSQRQLSGCYEFNAVPDYYKSSLKLRSKETYNGVPIWEKSVEVRIYYKLFPLLVKLERDASGLYSVFMRGQNPMNLSLSVYADYICSDGFAGSLSGKGKYADINNYCPGQPGFGQLDPRVNSSNLDRIDFTIRGDRGDSSYPRLISNDKIYVGDAGIIYGPGNDMCPAVWPWFPEDSAIYLEKNGGGIDSWGTGNWIEGYDGKFETGGLVYYTVFKYYGIELFSVKELGNCSWRKDYDDDCRTAPFYFANGCMEYAAGQWSSFKPAVRWPSKAQCGANINLMAPGRDLFVDYDGRADVKIHKVVWYFTYWKNLLGKYKTQHNSKYYEGRPYMTINSSVRWIGGNTSENGMFL